MATVEAPAGFMRHVDSYEAAGDYGPRLRKWGKIQVQTALARPGLIVVDADLSVVASNSEALKILAFPERPENIQHLELWLSNKIRTDVVGKQSRSKVLCEFHSAKRTYVCRSFPVDLKGGPKSGHTNGAGSSEGLLIVMLERKANEVVMVAEIAERFGLTAREQQTVQFLLEGLTSKEIAERMKISPNTVKAFIRLVMVKMGVSTRSGIIGKIVGSRTGSEVGRAEATDSPLPG
jgi:DNA-binding CsgD family transcriptional regulator